MAKAKSVALFGNPDGYRFVDEKGNTTAVLEASGRFSLREANASLEVHESWKDFCKTMDEAPTTSTNDEDILNQLGNMGLGRWEPINREALPKSTPKEPDMAKEATIQKKKAELAKVKGTTKPAAAKPAAKPKKEAAPKELHDCPCGCGERVAREFKQGHDARVHGWQKKVTRGEMKLSELAPIAQKWMKDHGVKQGVKSAA